MATASPDMASGRAAIGYGKSPPADLKPPHLPLDVFGHALDYVPYGDVQSTLAISKTFRADAMMKTVKVLNFVKGSQLGHRSSGRCFPNVEEANCFSLWRLVPGLTPGEEVNRICDVTRLESSCFCRHFPSYVVSSLVGLIIESGGLEGGFIAKVTTFLFADAFMSRTGKSLN